MVHDQASLDKSLKERIRSLAHPLQPKPTDIKPRLHSPDNIKAVIFDVYGTMLVAGGEETDSEAGVRRGNEEFLRTVHELELEIRNGLKDSNPFELFQNTIRERRRQLKKEGVPVPEVDVLNIWRRVFELLEARELIGGNPSEDEELIQRFAVEFELRFNPCWPMPHLQQTLDRLSELEYVMGIVSNSQFYTPLTLEALLDKTLADIGFTPNLIRWSYEHGLAKPAVGFYQPLVERLSKQFNINPSETIFIGNDMLNDIYPTCELGLKTALFAADRRSLKLRRDDDRTRNLHPDLVLTDFSQLMDCI